MTEVISTDLRYFTVATDGEKPWSFTYTDPKTGKRGSNWESQIFKAKVTDVRGKETETTGLDVSGFQFFKQATKVKDFTDPETIQNEYYPEQIELIKKLTGASRVVIFDHTIRRRDPTLAGDDPRNRQPATFVHVDQSAAAAVARVRRHLPAEEVPKLLSKRFQIINLWRPISHAAHDAPLALCDYRSIDPNVDLVTNTLKYPDREGETYLVKHNPKHDWKYLRGMNIDEGVLIKCADSVQDGSVAVLTPHTSFVDPTTPKDAPFRESIELRTLVFYD